MDLMVETVAFNNAGVACFDAGNKRVARDLFRGALVILLGVERTASPSFIDGSPEHCAKLRARHHLQNVDTYIGENAKSLGQLEVSDKEGCLSMHTKAFLIQGDEDASNLLRVQMQGASPGGRLTRTRSAIILFNWALVEQVHNPSSPNVVSLYNSAFSLLRGSEVVEPFVLAIMNNLAVWHLEMGDTNAAEGWVQELTWKIRLCSSFADEKEKEVFIANIVWMLVPATRRQRFAAAAA
jgi:hypothetical protein